MNAKSTLRLQPSEAHRAGSGFPAWIEGEDRVAPAPLAAATPRVRDGLVLRTVAKGRGEKRRANDAGGR